MARKKKTSRALENAALRLAGMKAIDINLSFGDTLTLNHMSGLIDELQDKVEAYNTALSVIDSSKTAIADLEKRLNELSEKMLIGVAFTYGNDSPEYGMAGGVRKSDRVRKSINSRIKSSATN